MQPRGEVLRLALIQGLLEEGALVGDLGVISTDMLYFAVGKYEYDGGIVVTASHNPREYNGFKMVKKGVEPISGLNGIPELQKRINQFAEDGLYYIPKVSARPVHAKEGMIDDYLDMVFSFVDWKNLKPATIAVNANHGATGGIIDYAIKKFNLPLKLAKLYYEPNGDFPQGRPDPLQKENQEVFQKLFKSNVVDFGVAWDADADRFFFFDERGEFVNGYYLTAVLAKIMLGKKPGSKIIHDPRLTWAVRKTVTELGGEPLVNRCGHSFIKQRMKEEQAVFAGENSGHFYFLEACRADNGLIPFFLLWELWSQSGQKASAIFEELKNTYFISGELNFTVENKEGIITEIEKKYSDAKIEKVDGLSFEYEDWRANVRSSNTEPLLRLNIEARSQELLDSKVEELKKLII